MDELFALGTNVILTITLSVALSVASFQFHTLVIPIELALSSGIPWLSLSPLSQIP